MAVATKSEAAEEPRPDLKPGHVWCRITKFGNGKVSTGEINHPASKDEIVAGEMIFPFHKTGEIIALPRSIAEAQEDNGNLEIQD